MTNYLCMQKSNLNSPKREKPSPSQMEEMYKVFNQWKDKYKENIVDMGGSLKGKGKLVSSDTTLDVPLPEVKELIGGYMIICANDMEEAIQVVKECPGVVMPDSSVEIREINTH